MNRAALFVLLVGLGSSGCGSDAASVACGEWVPAIDAIRLEGTVTCGTNKAALKAEYTVGIHKGTCLGDGRFSVPDLPAGIYPMRIFSPGYVDHVEDIEIRVAQTTICSAIHLRKK